MTSPETFIFLSNYRSTARERLMVEYVVISVISLVLGFVLGYAVRAAISARKRRKASRYDARKSWADARRSPWSSEHPRAATRPTETASAAWVETATRNFCLRVTYLQQVSGLPGSGNDGAGANVW